MCFGPDTDGKLLQTVSFHLCDECPGHGKNAHDEYLTLTKYHADRLMSILKYVFHDSPNPAW